MTCDAGSPGTDTLVLRLPIGGLVVERVQDVEREEGKLRADCGDLALHLADTR